MPTAPTKPDVDRKIKIFINDTHYEAPKPVMTGHELLQLAKLPETNQLFLEVPGPKDDKPVGLDEPVDLRPGMKFYDVPVGTFG
jgi:hypothetical protein